MGIDNGTTNYMLTQMVNEGISYEEALAEAQEKGYAEADPSADVDGLDAAAKIAILASIAFNSRVTLDDVHAEGIRRITTTDLDAAHDMGYCVKLLAIAHRTEEGVDVRVHPTMIPATHQLAAVGGAFNAIYVTGDAVGETMFFGQGAGSGPTASAVMGDVLEVARHVELGCGPIVGCTCTDGLPIDESPLFNPRKPFENRDPRCTYTIVEHGTELNGYVFNPHPDATTVMNYNTGKEVTNKDARSSKNPYCAYNCMQLRKGVQPEWTEQLKTENPIIIVRYADVLLMYAEAKIELDEIDQSVLDAINDVRARAYKVTREQTDSYPAVTTTDQTQLRRALRLERRMEFAWEGRRFWDLKRWRWFEKAFACDYYGCLTATELKNKIIDQDLWFWPETPPVDEDGFPDFTPMGDKGLIQKYVDRNFDPKTYLWPIPNEDVMISNGVLEQNDGY